MGPSEAKKNFGFATGFETVSQPAVRVRERVSVERIIAVLPLKSAEQKQIIRRNADVWLRSGDPQRRVNAQLVTDALNDLEAERRAPLIPGASFEARKEGIVVAFSELPPGSTDQRVIQVLLRNPGSSSEHLSSVCGWRGHEPWHLHFGKMCHAREAYLWPAKYEPAWKGPFYSGILATFDFDGSKFTMRQEAVAAFDEMGIG